MALDADQRPARIGVRHPLAFAVLVLILSAGALGGWLRLRDGLSDWPLHLTLALQLAAVPALYGFAHNAARPAGKVVALLVYAAATAGATFVYTDLAAPRELAVPEGFRLRGVAPEYYAPPALLVLAGLLVVAHWIHARRRSLRARRARTESP